MRNRISTPMMRAMAHITNIRTAILLLLALCGVPNLAQAQTYTLSPDPVQVVLDNSGLFGGFRPGALVVGLLQSSRPSAVVGRVGAVVIDPFQREAARSWPHVGTERREVVAPFVAHGDPAPAVVVVVGVSRIEASIFRGSPDHVFGRAAASARCSMREAQLASSDATNAPAALGHTVSQAWSDNLASGTAGTAAQPSRMPINATPWHLPYHGQLAKATA